MCRVIRGKMRHFLFHTEFSVCTEEKQVSSVYGMKGELMKFSSYENAREKLL